MQNHYIQHQFHVICIDFVVNQFLLAVACFGLYVPSSGSKFIPLAGKNIVILYNDSVKFYDCI